MPLDRIQARKLVDAARSAYGRGIHSEFINKIADQLRDALDSIDASASIAANAQNDVARLQRDLDEEKTHYRKLRETSAHTETMVVVLREIAKSPKGAQRKAQELLLGIGLTEPAKEPPRTVVE